MRDFTLVTYTELLMNLKNYSYNFYTLSSYINTFQIDNQNRSLSNSDIASNKKSICILRHDVDRLPENALRIAKIENELGIKSSYYFRILPESYDESIISQISNLGHEIGYHYEEMALVYSKLKMQFAKKNIQNVNVDSLIDSAYELFKTNLKKIRSIVPITTICMQGSPLSPYDNKLIWSKYNYRDLGIIGEPYFDLDWGNFRYFTDTGRRWNGEKFNLRDKVDRQKHLLNKNINHLQNEDLKNTSRNDSTNSIIHIQSTFNIINAIQKQIFPKQVMINLHPQRWTDNHYVWYKEYFWQNFKNVIKRIIIKGK